MGAVSAGAIAVGEHFLVYVAVSAVAANAVAGASYADAACAVAVSQTCPGSSPECKFKFKNCIAFSGKC